LFELRDEVPTASFRLVSSGEVVGADLVVDGV